ncbi:hypothetical protein Ndes2526A_g04208 [Nannochloris sp. 'desiccata']
MHGSFLGYLLLFQALICTAYGRNRMLLAPEVEMQAIHSRQPVLLTPKAALAENGAAAGSGSPTLVSLVVESQQGVNVTYLNLTITSSGEGSSEIVSLEPLPPPPLPSVRDPANNSSTEGQGTAVAESLGEKPIINIAVQSPEIELVSAGTVSVESLLEAPPVAEPAIEEVALAPPLAEIIKQESNVSNDTFLRLVPSPEIVALSLLNLEAIEVAAVPAPEPEPFIEPPVATTIVAIPTAALVPAVEPPISEPSIEVQNNLTAGIASENLASAPVPELVQQTPSPPPSPPRPPPPPLPLPPPPPAPIPAPEPVPDASVIEEEREVAAITAVPAPEIEAHDPQTQEIFDEKTAPEPEVQPTAQATEEELTDRINQSLSEISDTIAGITQVLQVTSGS